MSLTGPQKESMRQPIETDRLRIRDIRDTDAEQLLELDSDPEVMRYIGTKPSDDVAWYRERIRNVYLAWQDHPWHGIRIVESRDGKNPFLGWVFVRPANAHPHAREIGWQRIDEVEIGYRYRQSAWGNGIATEAAVPLVERALADPATLAVVASAREDNLGSLRVLEKTGFLRTGKLLLPGFPEPVITLIRKRPAEFACPQQKQTTG